VQQHSTKPSGNQRSSQEGGERKQPTERRRRIAMESRQRHHPDQPRIISILRDSYCVERTCTYSRLKNYEMGFNSPLANAARRLGFPMLLGWGILW